MQLIEKKVAIMEMASLNGDSINSMLALRNLNMSFKDGFIIPHP